MNTDGDREVKAEGHVAVLAATLLRITGWPFMACESFTSGIGSCYGSGRTETARYTADRCCDACQAHKALTETELLP